MMMLKVGEMFGVSGHTHSRHTVETLVGLCVDVTSLFKPCLNTLRYSVVNRTTIQRAIHVAHVSLFLSPSCL